MANSEDAIDRLSTIGLGPKNPVPKRNVLFDVGSDSFNQAESEVTKSLDITGVIGSSTPAEALPELIRSTIRLELDIDEGLKTLCRKQKITRETFMEGAYLACLKDERIRKLILKEAQAQLKKRRVGSDRRRLQKLTEKLGNSLD